MIGAPRPAYGDGSLADVLPSVLAALGLDSTAGARPILGLPPADLVCLLLVDGLGLELLTAADRADAPFLRELVDGGDDRGLDAGFPSSTPISLCSLGTGRPPGEHGVVGFTMHVPPVPAVLECLGWKRYGTPESLADRLPPERVQPFESLFGAADRAGVAATVVSLAEHVGSGLTRAAFRGARFESIDSFEDWRARRELVLSAISGSDRALVYTYDARLDAAAHGFGVGSPPWREALRATDRLVRDLVSALPPGAVLLITGDHGAVNVTSTDRADISTRPDLAEGVAWLSGDPRARHVHVEAEEDAGRVLEAWRAGLHDGWLVLSRDEAIDAGLFGPTVRDEVRPRIGDVVAIATGPGGVYDQRRFPWEQRLAAFHGGLSAAELRVPLLAVVI